MFATNLTDNPQIEKCVSEQDKDLEVPETYDFRLSNPDCAEK